MVPHKRTIISITVQLIKGKSPPSIPLQKPGKHSPYSTGALQRVLEWHLFVLPLIPNHFGVLKTKCKCGVARPVIIQAARPSQVQNSTNYWHEESRTPKQLKQTDTHHCHSHHGDRPLMSQVRIWWAGYQELKHTLLKIPPFSWQFYLYKWGVEEMTSSIWRPKTLGGKTRGYRALRAWWAGLTGFLPHLQGL